MSFRIAAASSDGINIDEHFGRAERFYIFDCDDDGGHTTVCIRSIPKDDVEKDVKSEADCRGAGCGGGGCRSAEASPVFKEIFGDCKYILASRIGGRVEKQLLKTGITPFAVDVTIDEAAKKLAAYENRFLKA